MDGLLDLAFAPRVLLVIEEPAVGVFGDVAEEVDGLHIIVPLVCGLED